MVLVRAAQQETSAGENSALQHDGTRRDSGCAAQSAKKYRKSRESTELVESSFMEELLSFLWTTPYLSAEGNIHLLKLTKLLLISPNVLYFYWQETHRVTCVSLMLHTYFLYVLVVSLVTKMLLKQLIWWQHEICAQYWNYNPVIWYSVCYSVFLHRHCKIWNQTFRKTQPFYALELFAASVVHLVLYLCLAATGVSFLLRLKKSSWVKLVHINTPCACVYFTSPPPPTAHTVSNTSGPAQTCGCTESRWPWWVQGTWLQLCLCATMAPSAGRSARTCWGRRTRKEPTWSETARPSREPSVCVFSECSVPVATLTHPQQQYQSWWRLILISARPS